MLSLGDNSQVINVDAAALFTQVVQLSSCGHSATLSNPYDAVSANAEVIGVNFPVAAVVESALEKKATSKWVFNYVWSDVSVSNHRIRLQSELPAIALLFMKVQGSWSNR